jgi:DNA-binding winged helix-turn-helix (wHTH) protein/tetratricopeptide (TPR) repeat protein
MAMWRVGPYTLTPEGLLRLGGGLIRLSPLQSRLLVCFVRHAGQLLDKDTLMREVWGHTNVSDVSMARAVHGLRQVLDQGPLGARAISTSYGAGYSFEAPVSLLTGVPESVACVAPDPTPQLALDPRALELYLEGRARMRERDWALLPTAERLLRRSLEIEPRFGAALIQLAYALIHRCSMGLAPCAEVCQEIEDLLSRAEHCLPASDGVNGLRAELLSLLHWQPSLCEQSFGNWLPAQLGFGPPLLSWARHLLATGRPAMALGLLKPHLDPDLLIGWFVAAQAHLQLGDFHAALTAIDHQLAIDPQLRAALLLRALIESHGGLHREALASIERSRLLQSPFFSLQAIGAFVLAHGGHTSEARQLLDRAVEAGPALTLPSLWALVALALEQERLAHQWFSAAVRDRCVQAPFVLSSPFLAAFAQRAPVQSFRAAMAVAFAPAGQRLVASAPGPGLLIAAC